MTRRRRTLLRAATLAACLFLGAGCSSDDDSAVDDAGADVDARASGDATDVGADLGELVADADLVVPREYLQGEWCDSDGQAWLIEGDTARLEDGAGGVAEFPIGILFVDGVGIELVSQTDDQFVFGSADDEVTFTRGSC